MIVQSCLDSFRGSLLFWLPIQSLGFWYAVGIAQRHFQVDSSSYLFQHVFNPLPNRSSIHRRLRNPLHRNLPRHRNRRLSPHLRPLIPPNRILLNQRRLRRAHHRPQKSPRRLPSLPKRSHREPDGKPGLGLGNERDALPRRGEGQWGVGGGVEV